MKTIIILFAGAAIVLLAFKYPGVDFTKDAEGGIQFHKGTFNEALQLAKEENKLVFLDIYATWCGPCKMLKSKTFSDNTVGKYFNETFVNVALDGEQGEGGELARKYRVRGYPTLLFINADGNVVSRTSGYHNAEEFIELGKNVKNNHK